MITRWSVAGQSTHSAQAVLRAIVLGLYEGSREKAAREEGRRKAFFSLPLRAGLTSAASPGLKFSLLSERGMAVSNLNPQTAKSGAPGIDVHGLRQ